MFFLSHTFSLFFFSHSSSLFSLSLSFSLSTVTFIGGEASEASCVMKIFLQRIPETIFSSHLSDLEEIAADDSLKQVFSFCLFFFFVIIIYCYYFIIIITICFFFLFSFFFSLSY